MHINHEFKARVSDIAALETQLLLYAPKFHGEDHQVDTYFNVKQGRLKLREGNIENALIFYNRPDIAGPKISEVVLYPHEPNTSLKKILTEVHGVKAIVDKQRRIYFIDNIKFHFDDVKGIGTFIEVEAIDADGSLGPDKIRQQCEHYARLFGITEKDYIALSYSDMVLSAAPVEERVKLSGITAPV